MYCLTRKNDQFYLAKSDLGIGSDALVKSMLSPKWYGSTWQLPSQTEKKTWMNFITKGESDDPRLNRQIVYSWRRCQVAEVDPVKGVCENIVSVKAAPYARASKKRKGSPKGRPPSLSWVKAAPAKNFLHKPSIMQKLRSITFDAV